MTESIIAVPFVELSELFEVEEFWLAEAAAPSADDGLASSNTESRVLAKFDGM